MDQHQHRQQQHQLASSPIAQSPSHADKDKNVAVAGPKHASTAAMAPSKSRAVFDFLEFVNSSPSPYHTVRSAAARLEAAGFSKISEWDEPNAELRCQTFRSLDPIPSSPPHLISFLSFLSSFLLKILRVLRGKFAGSNLTRLARVPGI
jgi:hypothetical protein